MIYGDRSSPGPLALPCPFGSKYVLLKHLATGGMADVFLARQTGSAGFVKECVIKRILPHYACDEQFITMFLDEARLCARLSHPYIAQVFDLGQVGDDYFIAMEHVEGVDLEAVLDQVEQRGEPGMPVALAARIIACAAEALEHAHHAVDVQGRPLGIVHRDVSPSNIMVSFEGVVKLLDFGIAKATYKQSKTQDGTVRGKAPYMSPEQVGGTATIDGRSDVFSLGAVLYELTTGKKPFVGESPVQIAVRILHGDVTPPSQLVRAYPPTLEQIVMRTLAKDPAERMPTARLLQTELEHFLISLGTPATTHDVARYLAERFPRERYRVPLPQLSIAIEGTASAGAGSALPLVRAASPPAASAIPGVSAAQSVKSQTPGAPASDARTEATPAPPIREPAAAIVGEQAHAYAGERAGKRDAWETGPAPVLLLNPVATDEDEAKVAKHRSSLSGGSGGRWMWLAMGLLVLATGAGLYLLRASVQRKANSFSATQNDEAVSPGDRPSQPPALSGRGTGLGPAPGPTAAVPPAGGAAPTTALPPARDTPAAPAPGPLPSVAPPVVSQRPPAAPPAKRPPPKSTSVKRETAVRPVPTPLRELPRLPPPPALPRPPEAN